MSNISVKYVSKKVSKVRWRPQSSSIFVTGSWDDEANNLCIWNYTSGSKQMDEGVEIVDPQIIAESHFPGGVTDIKMTANDHIFVSSTNGSLHIYNFLHGKLSQQHVWNDAHKFQSSCAEARAVAIKGNEVASVGEDGCLCIFNFQELQRVRKIVSSHLCAFTSVSYLRHQEVVTGNVLGYLKTWDLRSPSEQPMYTLIASPDQVGVMSMCPHPTQSHVLVTGHEDGTLCIWDLRQDRRPATTLAGHSASVTEILFHPLNPDYLYSCSMDGSIWQWNASAFKTGNLGSTDPDQNIVSGNPWLNCDASKHRLDIISLFPFNTTCVNSIDLSDSILLWGTDSEALYILPNITI